MLCQDYLVFYVFFLFVILAQPQATTCAEEGPVVSVDDGTIRGYYKVSYGGRRYAAFEGIPYARPPIGTLRFKEPQPALPWQEVLEAKSQYRCLQLDATYTVIGQEDCLYLNVYVPREEVTAGENLDVIVYIHGGAFMFGSSSEGGPSKLMDRDVVFVNFNYRLGPSGFLSSNDASMPGNYGLKDQVLVLQWVQNNIENFGGNPSSVTITGASAGAASVHLHYFSDLSKGLFHRGMAHSGSALNPWVVREDGWKNGKILVKEVGCFNESTEIILQCMQQIPALELQKGVIAIYKVSFLPLAPFGPTIEPDLSTSFLTADPYLQLEDKTVSDVPLITSMTTAEGILPAGLYYTRLSELNDNSSILLPLILEYYDYSDDMQNIIKEKILEYYFNSQPITQENYNTFVKVCTQRLFHIGAENTAVLQANACGADIYYIIMAYRGEKTGNPLLDEWGVGHAEDIKFYYGDGRLSDNEEKMKEVLVNMLVTYAKSGKPVLENVDFQPVPHNGCINHLLVMGPDNIKMVNRAPMEEIKFWTSLGLK